MKAPMLQPPFIGQEAYVAPELLTVPSKMGKSLVLGPSGN